MITRFRPRGAVADKEHRAVFDLYHSSSLLHAIPMLCFFLEGMREGTIRLIKRPCQGIASALCSSSEDGS